MDLFFFLLLNPYVISGIKKYIIFLVHSNIYHSETSPPTSSKQHILNMVSERQLLPLFLLLLPTVTKDKPYSPAVSHCAAEMIPAFLWKHFQSPRIKETPGAVMDFQLSRLNKDTNLGLACSLKCIEMSKKKKYNENLSPL